MMTLRQKFVKAAMQGLLANDTGFVNDHFKKRVAESACEIADAVIAKEKETSNKSFPLELTVTNMTNPCKEIDLPGSDTVDGRNNNEADRTVRVASCRSWMELKYTINKLAPFISHSRSTPVEHSAKDLLVKIEAVRKGEELTLITRANGLRAKVAELVWEKNYGDPWE